MRFLFSFLVFGFLISVPIDTLGGFRVKVATSASDIFAAKTSSDASDDDNFAAAPNGHHAHGGHHSSGGHHFHGVVGHHYGHAHVHYHHHGSYHYHTHYRTYHSRSHDPSYLGTVSILWCVATPIVLLLFGSLAGILCAVGAAAFGLFGILLDRYRAPARAGFLIGLAEAALLILLYSLFII